MKDTLIPYIRAGFAGLYVLTHEELRAEAEYRHAAEVLGYGLYAWSLTRGLMNVGTGQVQRVDDPVDVLNAVRDLPEKSLLVLTDFHAFLGDAMQPASPLVVSTLKDRLREARGQQKAIVIQSCQLQIPPELTKWLTVIEHRLPDTGVLAVIAESLAESSGLVIAPAVVERAAEAARGLATHEAEDIFALSIVTRKTLDPELIAREKARAIAKDGILELQEQPVAPESIGGLDALKTWLGQRRKAYSKEARDFGLPTPKGCLILGIPGTGKSLTAKATAAILQRPLLKLDAGKLFGGIVGESEANLRRAIATAEAIAPCVMWIDEIEKGFGGARSSGSTDGGTTARVFGSFLSWMQDRTAPVFVVATANDVSTLPPELLRAGRWDQLWFVDLPSPAEREAIWRIHLTARGQDPTRFDLPALAAATDTFTGAEIAQSLIDALYTTFDTPSTTEAPKRPSRDSGAQPPTASASKRPSHDSGPAPLTQSTLLTAIRSTVPLATTMSEQITTLRTWAQHRARSASSTPVATSTTNRRIA